MAEETDRPALLGMPEGLKLSLEWLADAPLFADDEQITALYDAVVRPETETGKITISLEKLRGESGKLHGKIQGEIGISSWIKKLLPFLDAKVGGEAGGEASKEESEKRGQTIELRPVTSPYRQLIQLTLHYAANHPGRMRIVLDPCKEGWYDEQFVEALPRSLVFLEIPREAKLMPMAAEGDNGTVRPLHAELAKRLSEEVDGTPKYPSHRKFPDPALYQQKQAEYWQWFAKNFSSQNAMAAVEEVVKDGGRLRWIDYRVPLDSSSNPLHLHVCGRGKFDTGVFAYNVIERGHVHGLRIVGTLKSGPDLNVLAILDR